MTSEGNNGRMLGQSYTLAIEALSRGVVREHDVKDIE